MMNNANNGINLMANVIVLGGGMSLATVLEHINSPNVGTVGHCDHSPLLGLKVDTIVIDELPQGTYDAVVESVTEEDGTLFIDFKTTDKKGKKLLMPGSGHIPFYVHGRNEYEKPILKKEQSWQALNKGNYSKRQRRVKF